MQRTDLIIQTWHKADDDTEGQGAWDRGSFITDFDLKDTRVFVITNYLEGHREVHSTEFTDSHGDRRRISRPEKVYLNLYVGEQAYGGPEEEGWWYHTESPIEEECRDVTSLSPTDRLTLLRDYEERYESGQDKMRDYYSVNARGMYRVRLEPHPAEYSPKVRPHYE